jgi:hypothetical protein
MNFMAALAIRILTTVIQDGLEFLKGSHRMGDGRIFLEISLALSLNKYLTNEPYFSRIHLAGKYL